MSKFTAPIRKINNTECFRPILNILSCKKEATFEARFWEKVQKTVSCWLWMGSKSDGYGSIRYNGKPTKAHRVSWIMHFGPIPKTKHVLHKCDNRPCVNPEHLWLGTNTDNVLDRVAKGRSAALKGSRNPHAVLDEAQVVLILNKILSGYSLRLIANEHKVAKSTIKNIKQRRTWKHVQIEAIQ